MKTFAFTRFRPFRLLPWRLLFCATLATACQTGDGENSHSGSTNWLHCSTDQDCEDYAGATCPNDGYCVDAQGERIVVGETSTGDDDSTGADDDNTSDDDGAADDDGLSDDDLVLDDDDASDDDGAADDDGSSVPMTPSSGPVTEPSMPAPEPEPMLVDAGVPPADLDASVDVPAAADASAPDASTCEFDSCHPERCDEIGEPCCDPLPGDGVNYCNGGLNCGITGCEGPVACGPTTCPQSDRCCDSCTGGCVNALSGANCPEDNRADDFVCPAEEQQFMCGETLCDAVTTEYCEVFAGGPGITSYTCLVLPVACQGAPTCDCVLAELGATIPATECSLGDLGELLVVPPPAP